MKYLVLIPCLLFVTVASAQNNTHADPNKFALIVTGAGGEPAYAKQFEQWTMELQAALSDRYGFGAEQTKVLPHATAEFATGADPRVLFDVAASLRGVRRDFATWNVVAAAIVTAWAVGLACVGLLCVGIVPGVFYAILVSAHATAALAHTGTESPHSSPG